MLSLIDRARVGVLGRRQRYRPERARDVYYERPSSALDAGADELERRIIARTAEADAEGSVTDGIDPEHNRRTGLHDVTYAKLRREGLSVTQARRMIRLRNRGALHSVRDLGLVPGLPQEQLERLRRILRD
jgi:hypothetical protein